MRVRAAMDRTATLGSREGGVSNPLSAIFFSCGLGPGLRRPARPVRLAFRKAFLEIGPEGMTASNARVRLSMSDSTLEQRPGPCVGPWNRKSILTLELPDVVSATGRAGACHRDGAVPLIIASQQGGRGAGYVSASR
jgi:hypothetical protein